ncbi:MAG TPA: FG-GAP-like repeat-containing protein [Pyrinomonadaceae bacterium]|nr:FG-GAP-like repeat-containing protein [Pyrinomonadaceae bacterium]
MKKVLPLLSIFVFTFLLLTPAFGQNDKLRADLKKSLKAFEIAHLNNQEKSSEARFGKTISLQTPTRNFELILTPRDLRSPNYRAKQTNSLGTFAMERDEKIHTFKGNIKGLENSNVRLTINDTKIEGFFSTGKEKFFIERARNFSDSAAFDEYVVYRAEDLIRKDDFICHSEVFQKLEKGEKIIAEQSFANIQAMRVIELATEADFEFVTTLGGANQANAEILSIVNMIEGVYERDLNLTFEVVFQHVWTIPDPYAQINSTGVLQAFQTYWNNNFPTFQIPRDTAHLWSGKANVLGQGVAYVGTVCSSPVNAYGMNGWINYAPNKYIMAAHEIGHNLNARHGGAAENCGDTIMIPVSSYLTQLSFCPFSRGEIGNFVASNGGCLSERSLARAKFDFDGDSRSDVSIFRPSNGVWYIQNSAGGFNIFQFGMNGDKPVPADYDGDGKTDAAVYREGVWYRLKSSNQTFDAIGFGLRTDIPAPADFDGDGKTDVAIFRPSTGEWHRLLSASNSYSAVQFGSNGDVPLPADYDGDNRADLNVFRPSNGVWYRFNSSNGSFFAAQFGLKEDKAIMGDFDGDGKADLAVWRPSTGVWYALKSSNGGYMVAAFGIPTDIPTAADYDGDGKTDIAVFRPSTGVWHRMFSSNNSYSALQFGVGTDFSVPSYYTQ